MTNDMNTGILYIHPSVPHHLMCIERIFRDTHGICHTTTTIILHTTIMCIRIREDDFHTSRADTVTCTRAFTPIIKPTNYIFNSKGILIVIISTGIHLFLDLISHCRTE